MIAKKWMSVLVTGALFGVPNMAWAICGDGVREVTEQCDDGNLTSMDGCSDTCTVETGYSCIESASLFALTGTVQAAGTPAGMWQRPSDYMAVQTQNNAASVYNTNVPADAGEVIFNMRVDAGSSDDDFIGWTIGLDPGEFSLAGTPGDRDYLLFNWKQGLQGARPAGLWFNRVDGPASGGNVPESDMWASTGNVTKVSEGSNLGATGWERGRWYQVRIHYSQAFFRIWVTPADDLSGSPTFTFDAVDDLEFEETGNFPVGNLGLYAHSQQQTRFELVSVNGPVVTDKCFDDTDEDGVRDSVDSDSDGDGILDLVEMAGFSVDPDQDSDLDGVPDWKDPDQVPGGCASMGSPAECTTLPASIDVDQDGVPNHLDLDSDGDGVPDAFEAGLIDANDDGRPDLCILVDISGVCTAGGLTTPAPDTDMDGTPDYLDTDDDDDGVLTSGEDTNSNGDPRDDIATSGLPRYLEPCDPDPNALTCDTGDTDGDGEPNGTDPDPLDPCDPDPNALACPTGDSDGDGIPNALEVTIGTLPSNADSDSDGVCDGTTSVAGVCVGGEDAAGGQNTDGDMLIDALDPDDDNDTLPTLVEDVDMDGDPTNDDTDGDGTPNYLDPNDNDGPLGDLDGDGITNAQEVMLGTLPSNADSDGDGVCDGMIDVVGVCAGGENAAGGQNTDGDMLIDALDTDDDGDGVLTTAEDVNNNGDPTDDLSVNGIPAYLDPCSPDANALACPTGDTDGDGEPNGTDPDPLDPCDPDPNALVCPTGDSDGDGISNANEVTIGTLATNADSDGDGVCDGTTSVAGVCVGGEDAAGMQDTDGDMTIDALDTDDDGDGVLTIDEDTDMNGDPTDDLAMSGLPKYLEPCDPDADALVCPTGDPDGDGVPNGTDPAPLDPCNPDMNHPNCDAGDTDMDGLSNSQEIALGTLPMSADSDGDGVCDGTIAVANVCVAGEDAAGGQDTDNDMTIDALDTDDDGDGIETVDEDVDMDGDPTNDDTDGDGIPNYLDPDDNDGPNGDLDGDGISNDDEDLDGDGDPSNDDTDGDGTPNYLDPDDDGDSILTIDEDLDGDGDPTNDNSDSALGDMLPNYLDPDDDGDGVLTIDEDVDMDGDPTNDDSNMDGVVDYLDPCSPDALAPACQDGDTDGDGVINRDDPDPLDPCNPDPNALACPTGDTDMDGLDNATEVMLGTDPSLADSDGDGLTDNVEVPDVANPRDSDMDGTIDALDPDDDGDGVFTQFELGPEAPTTLLDTDMDGTPDYLDTDDDGDLILTIDESADPNMDGNPDDALDTDMDGTPDYLDPAEMMVTPVLIASPADGDTVAQDFTISGTAAPESTVEVFIGGEKVGEATADANGDWSFDVTDQEAGSATIEVRVGNESDSVTVTVDEAMMPTLEVAISSPVDGATIEVDEAPAMVELTGTATAGETVEVFVDDEKVGEVTADSNGDWNLTVELDEGMHEVFASVTDGTDTFTSPTSSFEITLADPMIEEDEFADLVLTGGCQQSPAAPSPLSLAWFAALGGLFFRRRKSKRS